MTTAFVGLGSNLGDRLGHLADALDALDAVERVRVVRVSSAYESEPWGVTDQPAFANAVAEIETSLAADVLLDVLQEVETSLGRERAERYGPRVIDLDLLLYGDEEWESRHLTIPHPRLAERDFVVTPLLEIAPDIRLPDGSVVRRELAYEGRVVGELGSIDDRFDATASYESGDVANRAGEAAPPRPAPDEEWVAIGPTRDEGINISDFDLLFHESVLRDAGIPVEFDPHRPNEGFIYPGLTAVVRLLVPASRAEEAREILDAIASAASEEPDTDD